jgi:prepilin-type N-terminal cleavage/methylation domain-containing protein
MRSSSWRSTPAAPRGPVGNGFTLLELIIVLVIVVTLLAVAWPNLRRPLGRGLLREAGQQLARDLAQARLLAIESGQTLALRFEPGGSAYCIQPADAAVADQTSAAVGSVDSDADPYATWTETEEQPSEPEQVEDRLPHEVVFVDPLAEQPADEAWLPGLEDEFRETEAVSDPLIDAEESQETKDWSPPVLFYPTGRAENAEWTLRSPDGYLLRVTLRGLTGAVTLAKPVRETPAEALELSDDPLAGADTSDAAAAEPPDDQSWGWQP